MKHLLVLFCVTIFSTTASALDFNFFISDSKGCEWHIEGSIDLTWNLNVESYDVTATDCHGNVHHFSGIAPPNDNDGASTLEEMIKTVKTIKGAPIKEKSVSFIYQKGLKKFFPK